MDSGSPEIFRHRSKAWRRPRSPASPGDVFAHQFVGSAGGSHIVRIDFREILPSHADIAAKRQCADTPIGGAALPAKQARPEPDREYVDAHTAQARNDEVSPLVHQNDDAQDEGDADDHIQCHITENLFQVAENWPTFIFHQVTSSELVTANAETHSFPSNFLRVNFLCQFRALMHRDGHVLRRKPIHFFPGDSPRFHVRGEYIVHRFDAHPRSSR